MRVDQAEKVIDAPAERVFAAFESGEALECWLPPPGMTGHMESLDFRPGGSYHLRLVYDDQSTGRGKSSDDSDEVEVRYGRVERPRLIEQFATFQSEDPAFAGVMTMTWSLEPVADGTRVEIRCTDVPEGIDPEVHREALKGSLENLADYVESGG